MADPDIPWWREQLTEVPTISAVRQAIERIVSAKYSGWREGDREDLVSIVWEKYLQEFGKNDEKWPQDEFGGRTPPRAWLRKVVTNAAIDLDRRAKARPADLVDFGDQEHQVEWDARAALRDLATPSLLSARGVAAQHALDALSDAERELIRWALVDDVELSEIATRIGKTYEATKKAVQRATANLRKVVADDPDLREALLTGPSTRCELRSRPDTSLMSISTFLEATKCPPSTIRRLTPTKHSRQCAASPTPHAPSTIRLTSIRRSDPSHVPPRQ